MPCQVLMETNRHHQGPYERPISLKCGVSWSRNHTLSFRSRPLGRDSTPRRRCWRFSVWDPQSSSTVGGGAQALRSRCARCHPSARRAGGFRYQHVAGIGDGDEVGTAVAVADAVGERAAGAWRRHPVLRSGDDERGAVHSPGHCPCLPTRCRRRSRGGAPAARSGRAGPSSRRVPRTRRPSDSRSASRCGRPPRG